MCISYTYTKAQGNTTMAKTNVQVLVKEFLQVTNLSEGNLVSVELGGEIDFARGVSNVIDDNLQISTTVGYNMFARAESPFFYSTQGNNSFPVSALEVENKDADFNQISLQKIHRLVAENQPLN